MRPAGPAQRFWATAEIEYVLTAEQAGAAAQVNVTLCALFGRSTIDNDLAR
jgi:hypothetical protein